MITVRFGADALARVRSAFSVYDADDTRRLDRAHFPPAVECAGDYAFRLVVSTALERDR